MIYIASDHVGITLKQFIIDYLVGKGERVKDLGPNSASRVDYTDYAQALCQHLLDDDSSKGILVCGTGLGMSMMANRYKKIRAAVCTHQYLAEMTRKHNDANVLCLGSRVLGDELAIAIVETFLNTEFEAGRHIRRVEKLDQAT